MTKTILKTNNGEHEVRYDIRLSGSLGPAGTSRGFADLILLMRHVVDQPDLIRHAVDCPAEVTFRHDGIAWSCEAVCYAPSEEAPRK
jgi:hypothetical protein